MKMKKVISVGRPRFLPDAEILIPEWRKTAERTCPCLSLLMTMSQRCTRI